VRALVELSSSANSLYYLKTAFPRLPGLYDLSDPKAFIEGAKKEIGPGKPGLAKLAWLLFGPEETKGHREDAAVAMLESGDTEAVAIYGAAVTHLDGFDYKKLVSGLKDNKNGSLFALLERDGQRALLAAPKEVMAAIQAYEAAGGEPNKKWFSNMYPFNLAVQLDNKGPEAAGAAVWILKQAGPLILPHLNSSGLKYLKSKNLDLVNLGIAANARAGFVQNCVVHSRRYWLDPYYSSWDGYKAMPEEILLALRAPNSTPEKVVYDDAVLEVMRSKLLVWGWTPKLVEGFIKRAVDLPSDWAQKLRDVLPKPAGEPA
jgi:hypothetical protein